MIDVVGICLDYQDQPFYCSPNNLKLKENITVVVETDRGIQFGKVIKSEFPMKSEKLVEPLKKVLRVATKKDYFSHKKNVKDAFLALKKCRELVEKEQLKMQIMDCSYTFDRSQLMFRFLAESRVDFRSLAKELASIYKTRIELRQVGVRDKAKEIGGIGPCGRMLCCRAFLNTFDTVSISMAKNQNLSLNQTKINGVCGRLLCCLKYEDEHYTECKKCLPKLGTEINIEEGTGKIISLDILNKKYAVEIPGLGIIEKVVSCEKY